MALASNLISRASRLKTSKYGPLCINMRGPNPPTCHQRQSRSVHLSTMNLSDLKVNGNRLMQELHETCRFGTGERWGSASTETGMCRLALSDSDKEARDWFVAKMKELGCTITIDAVGNTFAVRPGRSEGPATFIGSHLDTQPTGGRYDGILGVLAGVEALKVLQENDVETEYPVGVVNWTNEEGARFPISMMGSGVWADQLTLDRVHALREVGGGMATLRSELERIGYLGKTPANYKAMPMAAHFELHIEQGPILETKSKKIGIVLGAQAYKWFTIDVKGRAAHTGTTPFNARSDALLLASKLILHSHRIATAHSALASTGILTLTPGSTNTIPGSVTFSLDIRSPKDDVVEAVEKVLERDFAALAAGQDIGDLHTGGTPSQSSFDVSWRTDSATSATHFHKDCIRCVRGAAFATLGGSQFEPEELVENMTSGAGHDSVYASRRCPTSMIFVPCRDGVSHNPTEYTSPEDCEIGAQVLLQSLLRYDKLRAERGY